MASDETTPGTPDDEQAPEPTEGVRLISADEVDKVADRENVAKRRRAGEPKYGDRPPAPPDDVRPQPVQAEKDDECQECGEQRQADGRTGQQPAA